MGSNLNEKGERRIEGCRMHCSHHGDVVDHASERGDSYNDRELGESTD